MAQNDNSGDMDHARRRFLRWTGMSVAVGGIAALAACKDDGIVGSESVPRPTSTTGSTSTVPPAYTATDNDQMNFALQIHYLLAAYLLRSLDGSTLSTSLTGGTGTAGGVTGGRAIGFTDTLLAAQVREAADETVARIGYLRRTLGSAATAQPALNIAGGQGSPFQATADTSTTTTTFFDPYASENDFLLGAVALFAVATSVGPFLLWQLGQGARSSFGAFSAGTAATDAMLRSALYMRATADPRVTPAGQISLFTRASTMAATRNYLDGPLDLDGGIGGLSGSSGYFANMTLSDGNFIAVRRSPERALGVLYASVTSVSAGGFYPAGMNGLIRVSGANL